MSPIQSASFRRTIHLSIAFTFSFAIGVSHAATWTVASDGSGDFTVIQDAVDASSSGDTIQIGPGIYSDFTEYQHGVGTIDICVIVPDGLSLTIMGAGAEVTTIGFSGGGAQGGILAGGSPSLSVSGCTFLNCHNGGISVGGSGELEVFNCTFDSGVYGVYYYGDGTATIRDCRVESQASGITIAAGVVTVDSCEFIDGALKTFLGSNATVNVTMSSFVGRGVRGRFGTLMLDQCEFESCEIRGLESASMTLTSCNLINTEIVNSSSQQLELSDCTLSGATNAIEAYSSTQILVVDSQVEALEHALIANSMSQVTVLRSTLSSGSTVVVDDDAAMITINECELLRQGNGLYYECSDDSEPLTFDFTNNAWGTTDIEIIRAFIHDCNFDSNLYPRCIDILPLGGQVATEAKSLSEVKSLFR